MTQKQPANELGEAILAVSPLATIYADREGYIRRWNAAAEALFGHPATAVLGQNLESSFPKNCVQPTGEGFTGPWTADNRAWAQALFAPRHCMQTATPFTWN